MKVSAQISRPINFVHLANQTSGILHSPPTPTQGGSSSSTLVMTTSLKEMIIKYVLIFAQILPTNTIRNIWRTVRRICMLILGLKGLTGFFFLVSSDSTVDLTLLKSNKESASVCRYFAVTVSSLTVELSLSLKTILPSLKYIK